MENFLTSELKSLKHQRLLRRQHIRDFSMAQWERGGNEKNFRFFFPSLLFSFVTYWLVLVIKFWKNVICVLSNFCGILFFQFSTGATLISMIMFSGLAIVLRIKESIVCTFHQKRIILWHFKAQCIMGMWKWRIGQNLHLNHSFVPCKKVLIVSDHGGHMKTEGIAWLFWRKIIKNNSRLPIFRLRFIDYLQWRAAFQCTTTKLWFNRSYNHISSSFTML